MIPDNVRYWNIFFLKSKKNKKQKMGKQKSIGITVHFVETYLIEPQLPVFYFHY